MKLINRNGTIQYREEDLPSRVYGEAAPADGVIAWEWREDAPEFIEPRGMVLYRGEKNKNVLHLRPRSVPR